MNRPGLPGAPAPPELTPAHVAVLERLVARGFTLVAFPMYASAVGIRRDSFAALLTPAENGGMRLLGDVCYLLDGNLCVRALRRGRACFVWKSREVELTPALQADADRFAADLRDVLLPVI